MSGVEPGWLKDVLRSLLEARTVWVGEAPPGRSGGCPTLTKPRRRHPTGLREHAVPEVAIPITGRGALQLARGTVPLRVGELLVLPPGVAHCETYADERAAYAALWVILHGAGPLALISRHRPGRRWDAPWRVSLRDGTVARLAGWIAGRPAAAGPLSAAESDRLRSSLLTILARIHELEQVRVSRRLSGPPSARQHEPMLFQVRAFLDANLAKSIGLDDIAATVHLTARYLNRLFREWQGEALHEYLIRRRMERAADLAREPRLLAKQIAAAVGYRDPLYFSRCFRRQHSRSLQDFRKVLRSRASAPESARSPSSP